MSIVPIRVHFWRAFTSAALLMALGERALAAEPVPTPESHLGFRPGADFKLATWDQVTAYCEKVDSASERVRVRTLGETTEGRPYLVVFVSSPETIRDLDKHSDFQAKLSDPRRFRNDEERLAAVKASKPVVVITCSIHSSETASTHTAMELLHELATRDDPATREILDRTILALVPSANPDGVDKIAHWYERSKGHPWEGSGLPELYHKYAGHDTNRDWFMLNLKETRLLTKFLYKEWFPTLLYDIHQMGTRGARIFVPPFHDPLNPNLDPRLSQGIFLIGAHMANDLATAGRRGVLYSAQYDNWWNGGNRTTPQRHNIVAVLTESASVRLATPIFLEGDDLKGGARGFPNHQRAVNFVDPWPGGWWRLRDIVDDQLICARSLLTLASRYHEMFQSNLATMAADAVKKGETEPPYGWVVSGDQRDPGSAFKMLKILHDSGIEMRRAAESFQADGASFPAGSYLLPAAQPYRAHLKDLMERQVYPTRLAAGGKAEPPYDVAGWTLPLQMGVSVVELGRPITAKSEQVDAVVPPRGSIVPVKGDKSANYYVIPDNINDDVKVRMALHAAGVELSRQMGPHWILKGDEQSFLLEKGFLLFAANAKSRAALDRILPKVTTRVEAVISDEALPGTQPIAAPRLALYQPWIPSMDEGWTRLVLEEFDVPYTTLHNAEIRAGALHDFKVLLIPSITTKTLREGYGPNESELAYVGGLGAEGVAELRRFVCAGGRLVCLDASCEFAIEALDLSVKDVVQGLPTSEFYGPGSILRAEGSVDHWLRRGTQAEMYVYFDNSRAFHLIDSKANYEAALRYAAHDPLASGWLLGPSKVSKNAAVVESRFGAGQVILFGFPPQHRGQTHATFRLLFNALLD
jgi:Zinc carboxypeptidase